MAGKELRKLSKTELLELLVEQGRENLALKTRLEAAEAELAERRLAMAESGSIAEAALKLSGVFEAAQKAIDLYRENCERECAEILERARHAAQAGETPGGKEETEG
ncbi:MAG: DNA repair protein [Clostridia bacterium]|nr:DNA repair protein [Clostridia bacterium]